MRRRVGWVLAGASALLWAAAAWVGFTFDGVTGPAILLGWILLGAFPLTVVAASILIGQNRREEGRQARERRET